MDLADQLAAVWARRVLVLGTSLLLAAGVFFWRSAAPDEYQAAATLQIQPPAGETADPAVQVDYYADTVVGLLKSRGLVVDALDGSGREQDALDLADRVTAEAGTEPGFVEVSVTDVTPEGAEEVLTSLIEAVAARVQDGQTPQADALSQALALLVREADRLPVRNGGGRAALARVQQGVEELQAESTSASTWRVVSVADARADVDPVAPVPLRDALLALLIALIVVAEAIVLRRAWRGSLSARDPARSVTEELGVPAVTVGSTDPPGTLAPLLSGTAGATEITVAEHVRRPTTHVATLLAELLAARGADVVLVDAGSADAAVARELGSRPLTPAPVAEEPEETADTQDTGSTESTEGTEVAEGTEAAAVPDAPATGRLRLVGPGAADVHDADIRVHTVSTGTRDDLAGVMLPAHTGGAGVLVVDEQTTRRQLHRDLAALQGLGLPVVAAVVQQPSTRVRRRWARQRRGLVVESTAGSGA